MQRSRGSTKIAAHSSTVYRQQDHRGKMREGLKGEENSSHQRRSREQGKGITSE
ncbi:hypothetical protein JHK82_029157 [Glycine max]|nr:hypothetical protein JHK85_029811 [Glycine max]KAG5005127.1 hypothetical protein JHK86_029266 [Glycine max]KAG5128322.1 hypothetical protein JHK82_029157 [Glycine max]KAG5152927.1 hypothetical protein JHK84_029399 [Glycine max]